MTFSRSSLRTSSGTLSPTPNMPRGRLSPPWMLSMPSRGKDVPCTDSEVKRFHLPIEHKPTGPFQGHQKKHKENFATYFMTHRLFQSYICQLEEQDLIILSMNF